MKAAGLLERLDDWVNPIVVRELRQAVRSRAVVAALMSFLAFQVTILGLYLWFREARDLEEVRWDAGLRIFMILQGVLLGTCMVVIPSYAGVRLGVERADQNVDLLFISTLRPRAIIAGKFVAAVVLALLLFSAGAPFLTFTYLLRGIDVPTILLVLGIDLVAVLFGTQLALFLGALPGNKVTKVGAGVLGANILVMLFFFVLGGTFGLLEFGSVLFDDLRLLWASLGTGLLVVVVLGVLLFCWSVALISPASSNRAPPGRLVLLAQWPVTGAVAAAWSYYYPPAGTLVPAALWLLFNVALFSVQLFISTSERDRWGSRVGRMIPRRGWLRPTAVLVYSGAAGGLLLAVGMSALTLVAADLWRRRFDGLTGAEFFDAAFKAGWMAALYAVCYGLSAVVVRRLFPRQAPATTTWLVGLALLGVGSFFPALVAYVAFPEQMRVTTGPSWWTLGNPFGSVHAAFEGRPGDADYEDLCFWFLSAWAFLAALVNVPWLVAQLRRFRPPAAAPAQAPEVQLPTRAAVEAG